MTRAEIKAGKLPEFVLKSLDETQTHELLGRDVASDEPARIAAMRDRLAALAKTQQKRSFEKLYKTLQHTRSPQVLTLQDAFKQLPTSVAEDLLTRVSPADLSKLTEQKTIPLKLKEQARAAELEVRLNRAFERLFLGDPDDLDTEHLVACLLRILPELNRASLAPGSSTMGRVSCTSLIARRQHESKLGQSWQSIQCANPPMIRTPCAYGVACRDIHS